MKMPLIGISASYSPYQEDRLSAAYSKAIRAAGGAPLLIPIHYPPTHLDLLISRLDGVMLSGGGDIDPANYPAENPEYAGSILKHRDALEIRLVRLAFEKNLPLLGICRGMQVMNVALGGTLYTDIAAQFPSEVNHDISMEQGRDFLAHEVTIIAGTRLHSIFEKTQLKTNSFHHQAAKEVAAPLEIAARSPEGLVEAVENREKRFFIGVQWHPECLPKDDNQKKLFRAFIQAARSA